MKKLFILLCLISLISCGGNSSKEDAKVKRSIRGIAAMGAVIEQGAAVQVRPASIDGTTPAAVISGTVGADGNYEVTIPESIPLIEETDALVVVATPTIPQEGGGFIIRVWSDSASSWVYSYVENESAEMTANVNPYTDKIVRTFYAQMNNSAYPFIYAYDQNIDTIFPSGIFSDGVTPINIPEKSTIDQVMAVMSNMLKDTYGLSNIQNALIDTWQVGVGLDYLLDISAGTSLKMWLQNEFEYLFMCPDALISSNIYEDDYSPTINTIHVDIWTAYGNTGNVTVKTGWQFPWPDTLMVKQPDSVLGNNHYKATIIFNTPNGYHGDNISIVIDDYQSGASVPIALKRY